jgi:hypothetical protein
MYVFSDHPARRARFFVVLCGLLTFGCTLFAAGTASAADIVRIEEDWELVVANPDPASFAPQVTSTLSPLGDLSGYYAVFDLNLRNLPVYEAGGMQLQVWNGDEPVITKKSNVGTLLHNSNETITWTQAMWVSEGQLHFAVVNGDSQTWGGFGSGGSLTVDVEHQLTNLHQYNPDVSVANSGIGFAANRVTSLTLKAVRAYSEGALEGQDTTPRVVYVRE